MSKTTFKAFLNAVFLKLVRLQITWSIFLNTLSLLIKQCFSHRSYSAFLGNFWIMKTSITKPRSSLAEVFLGKVVVNICSKFTGEHPHWSVISVKLLLTIDFAKSNTCFLKAFLSLELNINNTKHCIITA